MNNLRMEIIKIQSENDDVYKVAIENAGKPKILKPTHMPSGNTVEEMQTIDSLVQENDPPHNDVVDTRGLWKTDPDITFLMRESDKQIQEASSKPKKGFLTKEYFLSEIE